MIKSVTARQDSAWISMFRHASDSTSIALTQSKEVNMSNLEVNKNVVYLTQGTGS